jgi:hypothetical protein
MVCILRSKNSVATVVTFIMLVLHQVLSVPGAVVVGPKLLPREWTGRVVVRVCVCPDLAVVVEAPEGRRIVVVVLALVTVIVRKTDRYNSSTSQLLVVLWLLTLGNMLASRPLSPLAAGFGPLALVSTNRDGDEVRSGILACGVTASGDIDVAPALTSVLKVMIWALVDLSEALLPAT